jgi:hypothetical protein
VSLTWRFDLPITRGLWNVSEQTRHTALAPDRSSPPGSVEQPGRRGSDRGRHAIHVFALQDARQLELACFTVDIRIVAALVSRENERRPIAGRRTGLMHVSLLGWLSPFACALR